MKKTKAQKLYNSIRIGRSVWFIDELGFEQLDLVKAVVSKKIYCWKSDISLLGSIIKNGPEIRMNSFNKNSIRVFFTSEKKARQAYAKRLKYINGLTKSYSNKLLKNIKANNEKLTGNKGLDT